MIEEEPHDRNPATSRSTATEYAMPDLPKRPVGLTALLSDTMVFAATSVAAYLVALAFESGYAAYFGYPKYLIDVGFGVALTAWATILGVSVITFFTLLNAARFVPTGATLGFVKVTYPFLLFGLLGAGAVYLLGDVHWLLRLTVGVFFVGIAGLGLFALARDTRRRPSGQSKGEFWNALAQRSKEKPWVADNVLDRIYSVPSLAIVISWVWLISFGGLLAGTAARAIAKVAARRQIDFLVIHDSLDYVVVRRFPNYLVAAQLVAPDTISSCFRVYSLPPGEPLSMAGRRVLLHVASTPDTSAAPCSPRPHQVSTTVPVDLKSQRHEAPAMPWLAILKDDFGTVRIDTTRIQQLGPDRYLLWQRNSSDALLLEDLDCRALRVRVLLAEERVGPRRIKTLVPSRDTTWTDLGPVSRGASAARTACEFIRSRSQRRH